MSFQIAVNLFNLLIEFESNLIKFSGTFIPYDPVTDRDAPVRYGILAGTYSDGSPIYVGRGDNTAFLGMNLTSARVSIDPNRPGLYMTTSSGEVFRDTNATFLANHSSIMWIKVNASTSFTHPYAIKWMSGRFPMLFGRVNVSGYTAVGRVTYYCQIMIEFLEKSTFLGSLWQRITWLACLSA